MIETRGVIQFRDDGREIGAESPLVGASPGVFDLALPSRPPGSDEARERFDDGELAKIIALARREGKTFEQKKEKLRNEGTADSRMEKIHAGIYPPFNSFLRTLPMHEFP